MQSVFDGHNDVLLRLWHHERDGADPIAEFKDGISSGHIDAPRAKAGGLAGSWDSSRKQMAWWVLNIAVVLIAVLAFSKRSSKPPEKDEDE